MASKIKVVGNYKSDSGLFDVFNFRKMVEPDTLKYTKPPFVTDTESLRMDPEDEELTLALRHIIKKHPEWNHWMNRMKYNTLSAYQDAIQCIAPPQYSKRWLLANQDADIVWPYLVSLHNDLVDFWESHGRPAELEDTIRQMLSNRSKRIPHRPSFFTSSKWISKAYPARERLDAFRDTWWAYMYRDFQLVDPSEIPWSSPKGSSLGPDHRLVDGSFYELEDLLFPSTKKGMFSAAKRPDYSHIKSQFFEDRDNPRGVVNSTEYLLEHAGDKINASNLETYLNDPHQPISRAGSGERDTSQDGYLGEIKKINRSDLTNLSSKNRYNERIVQNDGKIFIEDGLGDNKKVNQDLSARGFEGLGDTARRINSTVQPDQWGLNFLFHCCLHKLESSPAGFPGLAKERLDRANEFIRYYLSKGWCVRILNGDRSNAEKWCTSNWDQYLQFVYPEAIRRIENGIKRPIIVPANDGLIVANHVLASGCHDTTPRNMGAGNSTSIDALTTVAKQCNVTLPDKVIVEAITYHWTNATPRCELQHRFACCKFSDTDDIFCLIASPMNLDSVKLDENIISEGHLDLSITKQYAGFGLVADVTLASDWVKGNLSNQSKQAIRPESFGVAIKDYGAMYQRAKSSGILPIIDKNWKQFFNEGISSIQDATSLYFKALESIGMSPIEELNLYSPAHLSMIMDIPGLSSEEKRNILTSRDPMTMGTSISSDTKEKLYHMFSEYLADDLVRYREVRSAIETDLFKTYSTHIDFGVRITN